MTELSDHDLLAEFAGGGSEAAFAALVARHVNLVYSAALRFSGNPHHAQEITQAVFVILTRKAGGLRGGVVLSGWLYQTARLTAANFVKSEIRRQNREQEAYMQSTLNEPDAAAWEQIAPLLEEAMGVLGETDRSAVVLRFFERKTAAQTASELKLTEAATHKRVNRALEKLRKFFIRRGVTLSAGLLAGAISTHSVQAAPAVLATAITATKTTTTTLALVKTTMKTMTWLKLKFALGLTAATLIAGGAATVAISQTRNDQTHSGPQSTPQQIAKAAQAAYAALSSYSDSGTVVTIGGGTTTTTTFNTRLQRPNFYRVDWSQVGGFYNSKGLVWSDGTGNFLIRGAADKADQEPSEKMENMQMALAGATGISSGAASTIPGSFFHQNWGDPLKVAASDKIKAKKENDQVVAGTDCQVISYTLEPMKIPGGQGNTGKTSTRLWIGKQDHLIHQLQNTIEGFQMPMHFTDQELATQLEAQNKTVTPAAIAALRSQMEKDIKSALTGKIIFTQTHENISVNQNFAQSDFAR